MASMSHYRPDTTQHHGGVAQKIAYNWARDPQPGEKEQWG
jgi:hypothetical protein